MEKTFNCKRLLYRIVKMSILQTFIVLFFTSITMATSVSGQELLSRHVSLNMKETSVEKVLTRLEKVANVKFSYNSRILKLDRTVSVSATNESLSQVLFRVLKPLNITFLEVSNRIILRYEESSLKQESEESNRDFIENLMVQIDHSITGVVKDENGVALPGVNILIKGTKKGTNTDNNGRFRLNLDSENATLIFTSVGYLTKEVVVAGRTEVNVVLNVDNKSLDEVVVVGYGTAKKATLTGAISTVDEKVFRDRPVQNAALALQGEVPGLVITRTSTRPGNEGLSIRLRGESSVTAVDPLIIIDGVPVVGTWEFNQLNPNDIESVTALKDASAAIYGARSAGGVILVKTKRGKGGQMKVNYNVNYKLNTIGISVPWADMSQWASMYLIASTQDRVDANGNPVEWFPQWNKDLLQKMVTDPTVDFVNPTTGDLIRYANNNWTNELYGPAYSSQHNLSLSGSTDKTSYMLSVGYANNKSLLKTAYDGEKKYNLRFNYDYNLSEKVKLETGLSFDSRTVESPRNGLSGSATGFFDAPVFPTYNAKGDYYDVYGYRNPVAFTKSGGKSFNTDAIARLNSKLTAEVIKNLTFTASAALVKINTENTLYNQTFLFYNWLGDKITSTQYAKPGLQETVESQLYQNYGAFIDYKHTFSNDHNFAIMVGNTAELTEFKRIRASRDNLQFPGLYDLNTAYSSDPVTGLNVQTNSGGSNHVGLVSYVSRANYNYRQKYLLEVLGRRDGSSKFHPDYRWANFYGISGGWVVSQEKFMQQIKTISNLKIRGSYGETGGQANIGNYDYISAISTTGTALFGTTPSLQGTANQASPISLTRTWERMVNKNIGLDIALFNNQLSASFDVFEKRNIGMLIDITYPQVYGATAPKSNSGELKTSGWEFSANWKSSVGSVKYNVGFQLSDNTSTLVSMQGRDTWTAGRVNLRQGYPLNSLFVYKTDGYFTSNDDVNAYYAKYGGFDNLSAMTGATTRLRPGDLKVVDLDGNNRISPNGDGKPGSGDVYFYGDANPHYTFGINLGLQWKGFDFSSLIQGVGQQNILRTGNARAPFFRNYVNVNTSYIGKTWTPETPNAEFPRMSFDANRNNWNWQFNDVNVQNLRYARLKSLVIGYTLPKHLTTKIKSDRVRFYFSGNDLFEVTSVKDGFDPERGESSDSTYPFARTWSLGLDISF